MRKRLPALLACAIATAGAGCGGGSGTNPDYAQVRSVVTQFAEASDARACALLSPDALVELYGGFRKPVGVARAACVRRSRAFRGEPVRITQVFVHADGTADVTALNPAGDVTYNVDVRKLGPAWRIDGVSQSRTDE
jgi:hypothetical protein